MENPSPHWIDRLIRRWQFLLDDDYFEGADAIAEIIEGSTRGDWAGIPPGQREGLIERLALIQDAMPWADTDDFLAETLGRWLDLARETRRGAGEEPNPEHWVARLIAQEATLRSNRQRGAALGVCTMLERLGAVEWQESGIDPNAIQDDGSTLYHRAARDWPGAIGSMMEADPVQPIRDAQGLLAVQILEKEWRDHPLTGHMAGAMRASMDSMALKETLPGAATARPRRGRL